MFKNLFKKRKKSCMRKGSSNFQLEDIRKLPIMTPERMEINQVISIKDDQAMYLVNEGYVFKINKEYFSSIYLMHMSLNTINIRSKHWIDFQTLGEIVVYFRQNNKKVLKMTLNSCILDNFNLAFRENTSIFDYKLTYESLKTKVIDDITKEKEWESMLKLK